MTAVDDTYTYTPDELVNEPEPGDKQPVCPDCGLVMIPRVYGEWCGACKGWLCMRLHPKRGLVPTLYRGRP